MALRQIVFESFYTRNNNSVHEMKIICSYHRKHNLRPS